MTLRVATADPFAYACVEYVCVCGQTAHEHGAWARSLPPGWVRVDATRERGDAEHLCPRCAAAADARAAGAESF